MLLPTSHTSQKVSDYMLRPWQQGISLSSGHTHMLESMVLVSTTTRQKHADTITGVQGYSGMSPKDNMWDYNK